MLVLSFALTLLSVALGLAVDLMLGETRRWHPLIGFGKFADAVEQRWNMPGAGRIKGAFAWMLVVLPLVVVTQFLLFWCAQFSWCLALFVHIALLYFCLGLRSLYDHTAPIQQALQDDNLVKARRLTSYIVSRDTEQASEEDLAKASVESLLENGCDAVFGTLFWFVVAGGAGALLYRLSNTLDAMWGYRTPRLLHFGMVAARVDDVLNFIPARLTALTYAVLGKTRLAWQCWRLQAPAWPSPNAGPVMAAGAGALGLALGGTASYGGLLENRPPLGFGEVARASDIKRAWRLVLWSSLLWLGCLLGIFLAWMLFR